MTDQDAGATPLHHAHQRRPALIVWLLGVAPLVYGFVRGYLSEADQARSALPWWTWLIWYGAVYLLHFEIGVVGRIRDLEAEVDDSKPKFTLFVLTAMSIRNEGQTLVLLGLSIVNSGAPSAVIKYEGYAVHADGTRVKMKPVYLAVEHTFNVPGGMQLTFRPEDAIHQKTNVPIPTGGVVSGRMPMVIDGDYVALIMNGDVAIEVAVTDTAEQRSSQEFRGTGPAKEGAFGIGETLAPGRLTPLPRKESSTRTAIRKRRNR